MVKLSCDAFFDALRDSGLADDCTQRVVIDIQAGHVPIVHIDIERIGDDRLLQVIRALEGVEITREEG